MVKYVYNINKKIMRYGLNSNNTPDTSSQIKKEFRDWLSIEHSKYIWFSPSMAIFCFDRTSVYAIGRKICDIDLWNVTDPNEFKPIYDKLLETKYLQITDKKTYKIFIVVACIPDLNVTRLVV